MAGQHRRGTCYSIPKGLMRRSSTWRALAFLRRRCLHRCAISIARPASCSARSSRVSTSRSFRDRAAAEHTIRKRMQAGDEMWAAAKRIGLMLATVASWGGSPALAADADHGGDLARRWCASCHVVTSNQTQASADVPSFASVARRPDFSPERLAYFLLDPHPKMPNFPLSRGEAADIAAYIGSLRQ